MWLTKILSWLLFWKKKSMPIHSSEQQQLIFRKSWANTSKRIHHEKLGPGMKIIGRVIGSVELSDIGRIIGHNQIVDLNEFEINNSKRLQHAIRMNWVEVIEDRGLLIRALIKPQQPTQQQPTGDNKAELLEIAKEMAKVMAKEMLKDGDVVRELVKQQGQLIKQENENLKQEIRSLKDNFSDQKIVVQQKENEPFIIENEKPEDIFIDINTEDSGIKSNIQEVGKEKDEIQDLSGSLEKMKRFRRKPIKGETNEN